MVSVFLVLVLLFITTPALPAQTLEEQVRTMRSEIQALRQELEELRREMRAQPSDLADTLPLIQAQVEEHAVTKVETNSKFPMKVFGSIASNTFVNTRSADWLDIPNIAADPQVSPPGSFSSTMRQTRIGVILQGPDIGPTKTSGFLAMDFFGGIPNFPTAAAMGVPRLLYAYFRLDGNDTSLQIGQDHMIMAPKNPTSLAAMSFPSLYRSGNLYLRAPQIRAERLVASGSGIEFRATGGVLAPIAGDLASPSFQFVPANLSGERSRTPATQARLSLRARPEGPYEKPRWEFGASGHYGRERFGADTIPSWGSAVDFDVTGGRFGVGGEVFAGRNMDAFGGAIAQNAKSRGGFIEGRVAAMRKLDFNIGYGVDQLYRSIRAGFPLRKNAGTFWNAIYRFTPEFAGSFEHRRQNTTAASAKRANDHFNLTFMYSF